MSLEIYSIVIKRTKPSIKRKLDKLTQLEQKLQISLMHFSKLMIKKLNLSSKN